MSGRTTVRACPHEADARDCGTCVAAAHADAVSRAQATVDAAPGPDITNAWISLTHAAKRRLDDVKAAQEGHRVLREHGIAPPVLPDARGLFRCAFCSRWSDMVKQRCDTRRCPGRRVRCQVPEVRT